MFKEIYTFFTLNIALNVYFGFNENFKPILCFSTRVPTCVDGMHFNNILFHQLAVVLRFCVRIITYCKELEKILDDDLFSGIANVYNLIEAE